MRFSRKKQYKKKGGATINFTLPDVKYQPTSLSDKIKNMVPNTENINNIVENINNSYDGLNKINIDISSDFEMQKIYDIITSHFGNIGYDAELLLELFKEEINNPILFGEKDIDYLNDTDLYFTKYKDFSADEITSDIYGAFKTFIETNFIETSLKNKSDTSFKMPPSMEEEEDVKIEQNKIEQIFKTIKYSPENEKLLKNNKLKRIVFLLKNALFKYFENKYSANYVLKTNYNNLIKKIIDGLNKAMSNVPDTTSSNVSVQTPPIVLDTTSSIGSDPTLSNVSVQTPPIVLDTTSSNVLDQTLIPVSDTTSSNSI
jgi:hypothetical protein